MSASLQVKVGSAEVKVRWEIQRNHQHSDAHVYMYATTPNNTHIARTFHVSNCAEDSELKFKVAKAVYYLLHDTERAVMLEQCRIH